MSQPIHDTPYRDESASHATPSRGSSPRRQASSSSQPTARQGVKSAHGAAKKSASHKSASHKSASQSSRRGPRPTTAIAPESRIQSAPAAQPARRSSRRRRGGGSGAAPRALELTSHPTSRNAYMETRVWLLAEHGPVCAYCSRRFSAGVMTLDHVQPRRGQTAYDRRDNLVLACPGCNMVKRDMAPLAFLLGDRTRAASLLRYGSHLSPGLVDLARSLVPGGILPAAPQETDEDLLAAFAEWAGLDDDGESPYAD